MNLTEVVLIGKSQRENCRGILASLKWVCSDAICTIFSPFRFSIGWRCLQGPVQDTRCHRDKDRDFLSIDRYNLSTWGKREKLQWMSPVARSSVHQCFIFPVTFTLDIFNHSFEKNISSQLMLVWVEFCVRLQRLTTLLAASFIPPANSPCH